MNEGPTYVYIFFVNPPGENQPGGKDVEFPSDSLLQRWAMLTPREKEVALLTGRALTNNQIAGKLFISHETVKTHMRNVLGKLQLHSKGDLRFSMLANGIVDLDERAPNAYEVS